VNTHLRVSELPLLRSESPSGMSPKLRTVAASNNRDHAPPQSLYYCLFAPHIYCVVLRAHPVRGESHIQSNVNVEIATPFRSTSAVLVQILGEPGDQASTSLLQWPGMTAFVPRTSRVSRYFGREKVLALNVTCLKLQSNSYTLFMYEV